MKLSDKARQVPEALHPATLWSRDTVLTYLTRMEAKGLVVIDKTAAPHRYRAGVDREACAAQEREALRKPLDDMEV